MDTVSRPRTGYHHRRHGTEVSLRCNGVSPACSGCTKFGRAATCSLGDDATRRSHDYVAHLQNRIRQLRQALEVGQPAGPSSTSTVDNGTPDGPAPPAHSSSNRGGAAAGSAGSDQNMPETASSRPSTTATVVDAGPVDKTGSTAGHRLPQPQLQLQPSRQPPAASQLAPPSAIDALIADIGALPISASSHSSAAASGAGPPTLSTVLLAAASKLPLLSTSMQAAQAQADIGACLPDQAAARKLALHYIQQVYPRLPFFSIQGFWVQFQHVYAATARGGGTAGGSGGSSGGIDSGYSYFTVLLVLAIATSSLSRSADSIISSQARRLFQAGLRFRESAILPNTIVGVQSLLFLIQFAALNPSVLDSWYLIGVGMRNCVDLGLHQDPQPRSANNTVSPSLLETRRRLWWSMYSFDRSMSIGCGRPTEIADVLINVQLPSFRIESTATDIEIEGYVQRYRALQLQSEIYDALNLPPSASPDRPEAIVADLQRRLEAWQDANRPERNSQTLADSEWLVGKMLLFRPCRLLPERSVPELSELWASARGFTALYRQLVESNGIFYVQIACEKVYWTGLVLLYSYWRLCALGGAVTAAVPEPETAPSKESLQPLDLWKATKDVTFILQTLSERWEDGKTLSARFDMVSARVIEFLDRKRFGSEDMPSEVVTLSSYASLTSIWTAGEEHPHGHIGGVPHNEELHDLVANMI